MPGSHDPLWRGRALLLLTACAASLAACKEQTKQAAPPHQDPMVGIVTLHAHPVPIQTILPGRTTAFRVAEIRPQVGGVVLRRLFTEGDDVTANQQLYQIDPAPYEAALASAQASVAKAQAGVVSAQATLSRYRPLAQANAVSRQDLDNATATVRQDQADVASAVASVKTAAINLAYTHVLSPIAGRTGRSSVTEGALVTANQTTTLVTVTQLNPIYVDVTQPSGTLLRFKRELAAGQMKRAGDNQAQVTLVLEDGSNYDQPGRLQFSEVNVDQGTGSVVLRAIFPNDAGLLLPGMFVREVVEEGVRQNGILAPQRGITHNAKGEATALVVNKDGKVEPRVVTTDRSIGDDWLVSKGLGDGDKLIVEGLQKVQPGVKVDAHEVPPTAEPPPGAPAKQPGAG